MLLDSFIVFLHTPFFSAAAELRSLTPYPEVQDIATQSLRGVLRRSNRPEIASLRSQVLNTASPTIWA